jgi:hypothetical protein
MESMARITTFLATSALIADPGSILLSILYGLTSPKFSYRQNVCGTIAGICTSFDGSTVPDV